MKTSEPIRMPAEAAVVLRKAIPRRLLGVQECMVVVAVDAAFRAIGKPILVAVGTANNTSVHIRDVFREAIRRNAIGVIVAHNHPTGDHEPSLPDIETAKTLEAAGRILGVQVLDNIVLSRDGYSSKLEGDWGLPVDDLARQILALVAGEEVRGSGK